MKNIVVAPLGDYIDSLYVGIKEFPTEKVFLITPESRTSEVEQIKKKLDTFKIPVQAINIKDETEITLWENTFEAVSKIRKGLPESEILVNVSTGDRVSRCAATSAAFVNGLKAFATSGDQAMMLPVMKFSYYKLISDKKMGILNILHDKDCCSSLEELSKKSGMSLPLISYHINGNLKSEGLKDMGLVETVQNRGRVSVELSPLGRMIIRGYVPTND